MFTGMRKPWDKRGQRRFTDQEVLRIREEVRKEGKAQAEVARKWGCSVRTIYECVTRMTYTNVWEDFGWKTIECAQGLGPQWLDERMAANKLKAKNDRVNGKNRRKPRDAV